MSTALFSSSNCYGGTSLVYDCIQCNIFEFLVAVEKMTKKIGQDISY